LLAVTAHQQKDCRNLGFDGNVDFEPQLSVVPGVLKDGLKVFDYAQARQLMKTRKRDFPFHPCIFVNWDNTPRRGANGVVFVGSTPEIFGAGLEELIHSVQDRPCEERLVFINAWNEWAEGNYLEPDRTHGRSYLEAVRRVIHSPQTPEPAASQNGHRKLRRGRKEPALF
jgi:hypothetical protein